MTIAVTFSEKLLTAAISANASDIHFLPSAVDTEIFFRIRGERSLFSKIPVRHYKQILSYYKFTSGMDIGEVRKPQSGTIPFTVDSGPSYSLRLSTLPVNHFESLAVRILPQSDTPPLERLLLFPWQLTKLHSLVSAKSGIILLTGPTGSGKTTTLYALLQSLLDKYSPQVITLEDPIEKDLDKAIQVQVNEKAGINFQTGLKAVLRHDPDILMIGEIRDKGTAQIAVQAALTGHLVLSTLHAKDAYGTIKRLLDMDINKNELYQVLLGVCALQLVPIQLSDSGNNRTAVLELLENTTLVEAISGHNPYHSPAFATFSRLRRKAYAYGYADQTIFNVGF
ncbi:competence type IV pilus ATPase ComGA [Sediminibacillus halophilus]|uniref:Competence protein ComGA n=1 Tax=Sediminibacillus halophilus TaxID=482461 RepID=A0A1G9YG84_9BACI|nr:competence type IV pilus ATPase ComGA [Sediminibacillus halophilus]SDN07493.1 competence protein ComGA [Sediminibacillus halophilus]